MLDGTQTSEPVTEPVGETAQFAWTETRVFTAVVVPLSAMSTLLIEHVPGMYAEALHTLLEDNADDDSLRPVFAALAAYAEPGDIEVTEVCDASVEY